MSIYSGQGQISIRQELASLHILIPSQAPRLVRRVFECIICRPAAHDLHADTPSISNCMVGFLEQCSKTHHHINKSQTRNPILNHLNPYHIHKPYFRKMNVNVVKCSIIFSFCDYWLKCTHLYFFPYMLHVLAIHPPSLNWLNKFSWPRQIMKYITVQFSPPSYCFPVYEYSSSAPALRYRQSFWCA
jgi:hypothetical protein